MIYSGAIMVQAKLDLSWCKLKRVNNMERVNILIIATTPPTTTLKLRLESIKKNNA